MSTLTWLAATAPAAIDLAAAYGPARPLADWLVILPVILCLSGGAILTMIRRRLGFHGPIALACLAALIVADGALLARVVEHGPVTMVLGRWLPPFGIAFTVDLFGALMALFAAMVAASACLFAPADIDANGRRYGFYPLVLFLMAGVSGAFLTGDIFNLYVWFEVLLISSFGLLVLGGEREQIDGAAKYGLLNLVATTLFLIATGYLYALFGTLNMADIALRIKTDGSALPLGTLAMLYLVAFGMKAAAFPVNFWLPAAYHTPKITVSALFGGLLTKVGIYALVRVLVMLMPAERAVLGELIAWIAILTLLTGGFGALAQADLRRAIGYMVISGIGILLAGLALGDRTALTGVIFYAVHSMLAMTALYFAAGLAGRAARSFDLNRMAGLYAWSPLLSGLALALLLAAAGLPPFSGFWPKVLLVGAAIAAGKPLLATAILVGGFLVTLAGGRIFLLAFWRPATDATTVPTGRPEPVPMAVVAALTGLVVLLGLWPEPLVSLAEEAASGLLDPAAYSESVFPGARQ